MMAEPGLEWVAGTAAGALGVGLIWLATVRAADLASSRGRAAERAAAHDRFIDLLKVLGLLAVVLGHWLAVYLERSPSGMQRGNILALRPWLWPATWLIQVMPVFFFAGGAANAFAARAAAWRGDSYADFVVHRLVRLLRPVLVLCAVWVVVLLTLHGFGVAATYPIVMGRLIGQPLWFLAVYVVVIAVVPLTLALHRWRPVLAVVGLLIGVVAVDVARLALGWTAAGFANLALVWVLIHQLGYWYADGWLPGLPRRVYIAACLGGIGLLAVLVAGPYPMSMVGLPGAPVSNMNPPTVCIVLLGIVQASLAMLARSRLIRWLALERRWAVLRAVGSVAMPVYLWHLSAVALVGGVLVVLDLPLPTPGGTMWWLSRPLWIAVCAAALAPIVVVANRLERAFGHFPALGRPARPSAVTRGRSALAVLAVVLAALGLFGLVVAGMDPLDETGGVLITLSITAAQSLAVVVVAWFATMAVGYLDVERPRATDVPGD